MSATPRTAASYALELSSAPPKGNTFISSPELLMAANLKIRPYVASLSTYTFISSPPEASVTCNTSPIKGSPDASAERRNCNIAWKSCPSGSFVSDTCEVLFIS